MSRDSLFNAILPPETCNIPGLSAADVICGPNKHSHIHIGNKRFRKILESYRKDYQTAPSQGAKASITCRVVSIVRESGGRFLQQNAKSNQWEDVGYDCAEGKVSRALRSADSPRRPRIKKPQKVTNPRQTQTPEDPKMCKMGCGYFGSHATGDCCSKCWMESIKKDAGATADNCQPSASPCNSSRRLQLDFLQESLQISKDKEQVARDQLAASQARAHQTQTELDSQRKECCDLQQDNDTKQARLRELEEVLETRHAEAKKERQEHKVKLQSLQEELTNVQHQTKTLQETLDDVATKEQDLIGRLESLKDDLNRGRAQEEAAREELKRVQKEKAILAQEHHDLKQEQDLAKKQYCSLAASHGVAKLRLEALKEELGAVGSLYKETHKELVSTKRKREELQMWQDEQKAIDVKDEMAPKRSRWW